MLKSIEGQFDKVRVCLNDFDTVPTWLSEIKNLVAVIPPHDLTDNGKYLGLETLTQSEYDRIFKKQNDLQLAKGN